MSDYRKQFVIRQDGKGRWRWSLYESGMKPVAEGRIAARSYEACVADALKVADLAAAADIWDAERQAWQVEGRPNVASATRERKWRIVAGGFPSPLQAANAP